MKDLYKAQIGIPGKFLWIACLEILEDRIL